MRAIRVRDNEPAARNRRRCAAKLGGSALPGAGDGLSSRYHLANPVLSRVTAVCSPASSVLLTSAVWCGKS